jgi:predicted TIM-barrel fold metal-dependent hydrolase
VIVLVAVLARLVGFRGPPQPPTPLPVARFIDFHTHTAGLGAGGSGCRVSPALQASYKFNLYLKAYGTTRAELEREGDGVIIRRIAEQVAGSRHLSHAVVLALDGAIDEKTGELDPVRTEIFVPNEFVARETGRYTNLLWGASINPLRPDALERLDWAANHGAVLVKWIPSIMHFAPDDPRLTRFYQRLVALQMPLLCHTGQERSFTLADDALGDPHRLRLPLSLGVTVIAAHIASTGANENERDTDRLARLMREFPQLRTELSSLTQINKSGYLREALTRPEFRGRVAYGSDFPLINTALVSPWYHPLELTAAQMQAIAAQTNAWDRDILLKQALGVPAEVFNRSAAWLRLPRH